MALNKSLKSIEELTVEKFILGGDMPWPRPQTPELGAIQWTRTNLNGSTSLAKN